MLGLLRFFVLSRLSALTGRHLATRPLAAAMMHAATASTPFASCCSTLLAAGFQRLCLLRGHQGCCLLMGLLTKPVDLLALLLRTEGRIVAYRLHLGAGILFNLFPPLDRRMGNANLQPAGFLTCSPFSRISGSLRSDSPGRS